MNLMVKNVTRIKIGITINVGASVNIRNNIVCEKDYFEILLLVVAKMVNI